MKCLDVVLGFFTGVLVTLIVLVSLSRASDTTSVQEETPLQTEIAEMTESDNQCCCCCCCNRNNEGGEQE